VIFEGVPDHPKPDRLWALVERHRITVMGLSPTAVRALMPHGPEHVHAHDLSSLRMLGSTGEPWNPEPYRWLFENAGKARIRSATTRAAPRSPAASWAASRSRRSSRARSRARFPAWPPRSSTTAVDRCAAPSVSWS